VPNQRVVGGGSVSLFSNVLYLSGFSGKYGAVPPEIMGHFKKGLVQRYQTIRPNIAGVLIETKYQGILSPEEWLEEMVDGIDGEDD
jgi:hypothetical protein